MMTRLFKIVTNKLFISKSYAFNIYKQDLALNKPQGLICRKTEPTNIKTRQLFAYYLYLVHIICIRCDAWWGARSVMVIVVVNGHGDTSSNPGRDWLHFT